MPNEFIFAAASQDEAQQAVEEYVSKQLETFFYDAHPEFSEEDRKEYFSKVIPFPKEPVDWVAYHFCPNLPSTGDCQLLFIVTKPKPKTGQPGHCFVEIYFGDEAKNFTANRGMYN